MMVATTYIATRDSMRATSDEDRAMAHVDIARDTDLETVRIALQNYMIGEVAWLRQRRYASPVSSERADSIESVIDTARGLSPDTTEPRSIASVECVGLRFAIVSITR